MTENFPGPVSNQLSEPPSLLYRPAKIIVRVLVSSLAVGAVLDAALMAVQLVMNQWYPHLIGDFVPVQGNDEIALVITIGGLMVIRFLAIVLSVVMFCVWVFRANRNVRALGVQRMRFTAGWCVIWFFVPIMALFKPYQAVKEIYVCSNPERHEGARYDSSSLALVGWWWASWISVYIIVSSNADSAEQDMSMWGSTLGGAAAILSAILAIAVIITIHRRQERKAYLNPQLMQSICMECNYDLRASDGMCCPECGKQIPGRDAVASQ